MNKILLIIFFICIIFNSRSFAITNAYYWDINNAKEWLDNSIVKFRGDFNATSICSEEIYPVIYNDLLSSAAQVLCESIILNGLQGLDENTTRTFLGNINYEAANFEVKTIGIIMKDYIAPKEGAMLIFNNLKQSVHSDIINGKCSFLLKNEYKEIGVGYCGGISKLTEKENANVYLLVLLLATPSGPQPNWIQCGHVYNDLNNNGKFDNGEGLNNIAITDDNGAVLAKTLSKGQYCFKIPNDSRLIYVAGFPFIIRYGHYVNLIEKREDGVLFNDYEIH